MFPKILVLLFSFHVVLSKSEDIVVDEALDEVYDRIEGIKSNLYFREKRYYDMKRKLDYIMEVAMFIHAKYMAELEINVKNLAESALLSGLQTEDCLKDLKPQLDDLVSKNNDSCFPDKRFVNTKKVLEKVKYSLNDLKGIIKECIKSEVFDADAFKKCANHKLDEDVGNVTDFKLLLDHYLDVAMANTISCLDIAHRTLENDGHILMQNFEKCLRN